MPGQKQCYVVAENKPNRRIIVKLGDQYACIKKGQSVSQYHWRDHKLLSSMVLKGGYEELDIPVLFRPFNDYINKSMTLYIDN